MELNVKVCAILNQGPYREVQKYTTDDRLSRNQECLTCEWSKCCQGGCRGLSMIYNNGDFLGVDRSCCEFFKTGIYEKFSKLLKKNN